MTLLNLYALYKKTPMYVCMSIGIKHMPASLEIANLTTGDSKVNFIATGQLKPRSFVLY